MGTVSSSVREGSTRERIVREAVRLFGAEGFRGTSVAKIEDASGLSPGAGGLYHHFSSKEALLVACIDWHLERIAVLRDRQATAHAGGDLRAELGAMARHVLAEIAHEQELFRILAAEARARPELVGEAVTRLFASTQAEFASWLEERVGEGIDAEQAGCLASVGLGSLMWFRMRPVLFGGVADVDDDTFVATWIDMMIAAIERAGG
jgi:AcrR family transcriptional regulator